jgi:hypothetical protein
MRSFFRVYQYINILSIDIVAGAVVSAIFFANIFAVQVKTVGLIALGLTVWAIYTIDHLRDARRIMHPAATLRHRFHQENFLTLTILLGAALVIDAVAIFFIRRQVFEWGLVLTAIVILYLVFQHSLRFLKELFVASLYTAGVLLLSITVAPPEIVVEYRLLIFQFAVTACANLVLFSWFDQIYDQRNEQNSFATILGNKTTHRFLYGLFLLNFLLTIIQVAVGTPLMPVLVLFAMNVALVLIYVFRKNLEKDDIYRLMGDAVFLFPLVLFF